MITPEISLQEITDAVANVLEEHHLDLACDIRDPYWRRVQMAGACPVTTGFCAAAAAEAVYYLGGGKAAGLKPKVWTFTKDGIRVTHWWIEDSAGNIYDPTASQFRTSKILYHRGKGCGFQSPKKQPTRLAKRIMNLVMKTKNPSKDADLAQDLSVEAFFVAGTETAYDILGPAHFTSPRCVRCGAAITYVFATSKGPMGGDCLATLTGDQSTRKLARKIHDAIARAVSWYEVYGLEIQKHSFREGVVWAVVLDRRYYSEIEGTFRKDTKYIASFKASQFQLVEAIVAHEAEVLGLEFSVVGA